MDLLPLIVQEQQQQQTDESSHSVLGRMKSFTREEFQVITGIVSPLYHLPGYLSNLMFAYLRNNYKIMRPQNLLGS